MPTFPPRSGGANAITSLTGDGTASGPGAAALTLDATAATAKINVATASLKGAMSAADKGNFDILRRMQEKIQILGDANVTISPISAGISGLHLPPGTLTANRTVTLGNDGTPFAPIAYCYLSRADVSAFSLTINNHDGSPIFTFPASGPPVKTVAFWSASNWATTSYVFING